MTDRQSIHIPVLVEEVIAGLQPNPGETYVDGTLGGGGHTHELACRVVPGGQVVGLDRDPEAIRQGESRFRGSVVQIVQSNYCDLPEVMEELGIESVDGVLLDIGLSSDQLADRDRGFSFSSDGPLDLRFNPQAGEPAWQLLKRLREKTLADLIYQNGEERLSRRIARKIVERRQKDPIRTASELANLVRSCYPQARRGTRIDPATRTFQALRIAVNDELKSLDIALRRLPQCVRPGGRIAVISFHSLEDRRVKVAFRDDPRYDATTRKPITASEEEIERNPRSRSAKLRIAERTTAPDPYPG